MNHQPEFSEPPKRKALTETESRALAACYARVFLGDDDGKRVLADLRAKFGLHRLTFTRGQPHRYDTTAAAIIDGERGVISEIEGALLLGGPGQSSH
jgi:hypothetical protein